MSPLLFAPTSTLHIFRIAIYRTSPLTYPITLVRVLPVDLAFDPEVVWSHVIIWLGLSGCGCIGACCYVMRKF